MLIAAILPPNEGFGPADAGAIGMVVRAHAQTPGARCVVFGGPQQSVFDDAIFRAVRPAWWFPGNVNLRFGAALLGPLRRLRPALIEVHNRPELALFLARWLPNARVVLFLHNDPQAMRRSRSAAERMKLLQRLAGVVTVSEFLRSRLLAGVTTPSPRACVLPNGIRRTASPPPHQREPLILFVGRIVAEKGPDAFVAACAAALPQLPGWRAEMLGADRFRSNAPDTAFARQVRAQAEAAGVRLLGYRDHEAVLAAMRRAAIVVVPSRWQEPFGLVALEAMASGAALICTPRGGLPEVAGDAALYAEPDPQPLARAILLLAGDPRRRAALAATGLAQAARFDHASTAARLTLIREAALDDRA